MQREQIDLVLLDLMMPELDGFGVLEAMRENEATREIPVIVLTGQVLTERDMARLNRGVATVLSKGLFSLEETLAHVDTALERNRKLSGEAQRLVRQAMAYIHEHYAEPVSRTDLAQHVALSEDYLTACFRKELGVTPIAYLNRYRVNQAKSNFSPTRARASPRSPWKSASPTVATSAVSSGARWEFPPKPIARLDRLPAICSSFATPP